MFNLPIYKRGNVYTLHTRFNGKQVKLSLRTHDRWVAANRAIEVLNAMKFDSDPPLPSGFEHLARSNTKRYEVDLHRGIFKAESAEDHARMLEALPLLKASAVPVAAPVQAPAPVVIIQEPRVKGGRFTIKKLWTDFSLAKSLETGSIGGFETAVQEFNRHVNSRQLYQITHTIRWTHHISPSSAKLSTFVRVTIMWSSTRTSTNAKALLRVSVRASSALDGCEEPLGWL